MSLLCNCPQEAALVDVPINACPESLGQVQKVIFQRIFSTGATKNSFTIATADPKLKASWTPLLAAADGTKVVQSPYINAPTTTPGAAITYGSGNEVLGGVPIVMGREFTSFEGKILRSSQDTIEALKKLQCETVGVYLVDEFGRMAGVVDTLTNPTKLFPIPISSLFVGDKGLGGLQEPDVNAISWKFFPNWSDKLYFVTPTDFNALTDLITPVVES